MKTYQINYIHCFQWKQRWNGSATVNGAKNIGEAIGGLQKHLRDEQWKKWNSPEEYSIIVTSVYAEDAWIEKELTKYRLFLFAGIAFYVLLLQLSDNALSALMHTVAILWLSYYLYKSK